MVKIFKKSNPRATSRRWDGLPTWRYDGVSWGNSFGHGSHRGLCVQEADGAAHRRASHICLLRTGPGSGSTPPLCPALLPGFPPPSRPPQPLLSRCFLQLPVPAQPPFQFLCVAVAVSLGELLTTEAVDTTGSERPRLRVLP